MRKSRHFVCIMFRARRECQLSPFACSQMLTIVRRYPLTSEVVMKKIEEFNVLPPSILGTSCCCLISNPLPPLTRLFRRLCSSATFAPPSPKSRLLSRLCTTSLLSASTPSFGNPYLLFPCPTSAASLPFVLFHIALFHVAPSSRRVSSSHFRCL